MLNVTHTAVARHVKELETWFGVELVETNSKGTTLNAEGRRLHGYVSDAFSLIARGTAEIRPAGSSGGLRIWAMPGFATFWILPRLAELQRLLPRVTISLLPIDQIPSFDSDEADVAICFESQDSEDLVNVELIRPRVRVLASSRWIAQHPQINSPEALAEAELVHERRSEVWSEWFTVLGIRHQALRGPRLGVLPAVVEALHRDQGPGLIPEMFIDEHLLRNNLEPVVEHAPRLHPYILVYRRDRARDDVIMQFTAWLRESLVGYQP
jgi:LysR family glycine cleavage system transcriptional activator